MLLSTLLPPKIFIEETYGQAQKTDFLNYISISMLFGTFSKNNPKIYYIMNTSYIRKILVYENISNILINCDEIAHFI